MPIYGHTFFGHISANFWPIKLKFHMATQETIIYRLMMRNQRKDLLFKNSKFLALIWPQKGRGPTLCHKGPGTQDWTKKFANGMELLGHTLSQNYVSKNFRSIIIRKHCGFSTFLDPFGWQIMISLSFKSRPSFANVQLSSDQSLHQDIAAPNLQMLVQQFCRRREWIENTVAKL